MLIVYCLQNSLDRSNQLTICWQQLQLLLRAKPLHTLVLIAAILISQTGPIILVAAGPLLVRRATFGRGAVARAADAEIPTPGLAVGWPRQRDITTTPGSTLLTVDAKAGRSRDAGGDGRGRGLAEGGSGADLRPNTRIRIAAGRDCAVDVSTYSV